MWAKVFPSRKFPARFVLQLFMGPISSAELTQAKRLSASAATVGKIHKLMLNYWSRNTDVEQMFVQ